MINSFKIVFALVAFCLAHQSSWAQDGGDIDYIVSVGAVAAHSKAIASGSRSDCESKSDVGVRIALGLEKRLEGNFLLGAEALANTTRQRVGRGDKIHYSVAIVAKPGYQITPSIAVHVLLGMEYAKTNALVSDYQSFKGAVYGVSGRYKLSENGAVNLGLEQTAYGKQASSGQTVDLKQTRLVASYSFKF